MGGELSIGLIAWFRDGHLCMMGFETGGEAYGAWRLGKSNRHGREMRPVLGYWFVCCMKHCMVSLHFVVVHIPPLGIADQQEGKLDLKE
jgi:hypothetical protein